MRTTKFSFFLFFLSILSFFLINIGHSQAYYGSELNCGLDEVNLESPPDNSGLCNNNFSFLNFHLDDLVPYHGPKDIIIKVNFVFLYKDDGTGNFNFNDPEQSNYVHSMFSDINALMKNFSSENCTDCTTQPTFYGSPNIQFDFSIVKINNTAAWDHRNDPQKGTLNTRNKQYLNNINNLAQQQPNYEPGINILFTINGANYEHYVINGNTSSPPSNIYNGNWYSAFPTFNQNDHALIHQPDFYINWYINKYFGGAPEWGLEQYRQLALRSTLHEIGHQFDLQHISNCQLNLMTVDPGSGHIRKNFSGCQLRTTMRSLMGTNIRKFVQCTDLVEHDITIDQDETWTVDTKVYGNILINEGATLTITCKLEMQENAKIVVMKGGRIIIDNALLTSCDKWQGIVVEGNGDAQSGAGKVVMTNNAIIENAKNGISMNPSHIPWPALANSWGGLVEEDNSVIRNCDRAVEFMQMNNDDSYFNGCTFTNLKHGVTLWDNEGVDFTNCNFSNIQNMAILTFDSRIRAYGNTITGVRDGVEIISSGASSGTSKYYSNAIDANRYAFDGTAQNGLKPLECVGNTLIGGNASFSMNGISNFEFIGNQVIGADYGARLHSTGGGQEADVHNNTFSSNGTASLVNHETNTEYLDNCFYYSGEDIQINSGTILGEQGDEGRAANNCFTKNGVPSIKVMNNGGSSLFTYHLAHIEQPTCKTPTEYQDAARGYDLEWGAPEVVVYCSSPVYIKYRKCPLPKNAEEYAKMKKELEDEIKKLETNTTMNASLKAHLIKRYKNCLRKIQREIIIIIKDDDSNGNEGSISQAVEIAKSSEFFDINILGFSILMDQRMYANASTYLQQMNTFENIDASDFVTIQNINLGYYNSIGNYQVSLENRNTLMSIGLKTTPVAGYARGLYYKLTGEKMEVNYIYDQSMVDLRNKTKHNDTRFEINMYPNPVDNNILNIEMSHFDASSKMEAVIYDTQGNMVKNIDISGKGHISNDVSNLSSGVYIVSFIENGHRIHTKRFVKI